MDEHRRENEPRVEPIKGGWAARGEGWAVHAPTRDEAIERYEERARHYREIDARPFWYEQMERAAAFTREQSRG
jgi:hypothetical protein